MTEKNCFLPILRNEMFICVLTLRHYMKEIFASLYERIICVIMRKKSLRHYAKELFAPDERFIYTTMRKKYLHSQHSLDIFPGLEAEGGSLFLVLPFYFYIEIKR